MRGIRIYSSGSLHEYKTKTPHIRRVAVWGSLYSLRRHVSKCSYKSPAHCCNIREPRLETETRENDKRPIELQSSVAIPKSESFTCPRLLIKILGGLISRWTRLRVLRYESAYRIWYAMFPMTFSGIVPS